MAQCSKVGCPKWGRRRCAVCVGPVAQLLCKRWEKKFQVCKACMVYKVGPSIGQSMHEEPLTEAAAVPAAIIAVSAGVLLCCRTNTSRLILPHGGDSLPPFRRHLSPQSQTLRKLVGETPTICVYASPKASCHVRTLVDNVQTSCPCL